MLLLPIAPNCFQARHDGQAARTQLQLAMKAQPSIVERYFIFAVRSPCQGALSSTAAKALPDSSVDIWQRPCCCVILPCWFEMAAAIQHITHL